MRRQVVSALIGGAFLISFALLAAVRGQAQSAPTDESRVQEGLRIAPVILNLKGRNRALVGIGSYLVNAVSECNDCHTRPHFLHGGNPFLGEQEIPNGAQHLTGGNQFGPFTSANLTPDPITGLPAGLTFDEFRHLLRTGETDDHPQFGPLMQVMPWPTFRKMTDNDLRAIYEYLSAIPSRPDNPSPGECCPEE
jgi:hypothetical protein